MPGRDITRRRNRAARVLLFTFVIWAAAQSAVPAWSQAASLQNDSKPATPPASLPGPGPAGQRACPPWPHVPPLQNHPNPAPPPPPPPGPPPATPPQTQDKQDKQEN